MPRYFTRDQAFALLPKIEQLLREALDFKSEIDSTEKRLREASRRISMLGGVVVRHQELIDLRARHDVSINSLKALVERIHETGCQIKDLDLGLVDFPTLYRDEEVLLCWKLGESGISFWHGLEEGFRGRKPIDADFLANHRGGQA
jgi:hypothetical protein